MLKVGEKIEAIDKTQPHSGYKWRLVKPVSGGASGASYTGWACGVARGDTCSAGRSLEGPSSMGKSHDNHLIII